MNQKFVLDVACDAASAALTTLEIIENNRVEDEEGCSGITNDEYLTLSHCCDILRKAVDQIPDEVKALYPDLSKNVGECYPHMYRNDDDDGIYMDGLRKRLYPLHAGVHAAYKLYRSLTK